MYSFSNEDRQRLRALASEQAEIAASPAMKQLYDDWERHGRLDRNVRPMVSIELHTFADEIIPSMLRCKSNEAREIETTLLSNIIPFQMFGDDTPVRAYYPVNLKREFIAFNLPPRRECSGDSNYIGVGHRFEPYIHDLEEDFHLLQKSTFSIDSEGTQREIEAMDDLLGDLLPVRPAGEVQAASLIEDILHVMRMEDFYVAMLDEPELVHQMIDMLVDDYNAYFDLIESSGLLRSTTYDESLYQGSYCFHSELPRNQSGLTTKQVWGYMDAEEMNDVSSDLYKEFVSEPYQRIACRFGALSYGCCEAVHRFWEDSIENIPNVRKLSISAWCDVHKMGECLRGSDITFVRKPSANFLGVTRSLDEDAAAAYFRETAEAARGCLVEITQRDVYLLHGNVDKVRRYIQIGKEMMEKYWRP